MADKSGKTEQPTQRRLENARKEGQFVSAKEFISALRWGFLYQGQKQGRGSPALDLPATAFINFMQNHDQIGNRAFGERLISLTEDRKLKALAANPF